MRSRWRAPAKGERARRLPQAAGDDSSVIRLQNVGHTYELQEREGIEALTGINVEIHGGEFLSIVGPSGCGKSTLLRLLAGLDVPTSGQITMDGTLVRGVREDVGFVFQSPVLLEWRTARENVLLPIECHRKITEDDRNTASELLALARLAGFGDRRPSELSGGMQQRVAICRALITDPKVLLMDEPFGALDALTRESLSLELLRIWSERRKTVVFVTHSIPEALLLSDRIFVFSDRPGTVIEIVDVPFERPRTIEMQATAEFAQLAGQIRARLLATMEPDSR